MTRIPFILLSTTDGSPLTGAAPTVTISKDGGAFASATNTPAEIGNGYYYIDLTTAEKTVTNNVIVRATATGAQPTAVVWEPEPTIPTAADNATAVWGANTRTLTASPTDISGLATSSALSAVASNVTAVKAKTDNLPASPAAVGSEMALTSETVTGIKNGLSTFNPSTDAVTIDSTQAATLATAAALTTVGDNVTAVKAKTDNLPQAPAAVGSAMALTSETVTGIKNGLSTFDPSVSTVTINSTQAATFATAASITPILALLETLYSGMFHWEVQNNELTIYDSDGLAISAYTLTKDAIGNIIAVTPED